jgi:hypothetical protein
MPRGIKNIKEDTKVNKSKAIRKTSAKKVIEEEFSNSEQESDDESKNEPVSFTKDIFKTTDHAPVIFIKNTALKSTDSDRLHLAQAINNFTLKSEQLMQEMHNFDKFKESVARLDILIESKKKEYDETIVNLEAECLTKSRRFDSDYKDKSKRVESEFKESTKQLEATYNEKNKQLDYDYRERNKQLEATYKDRSKQLQVEFEDSRKSNTNTLEDSKIDTKRKIAEDKNKYCEVYAKELKMMYMKDEEQKTLLDRVSKAVKDHDELKKTFDKQCDSIKADETRKHAAIIKSERETMDLTHKATNATLTAQLTQQKNEIAALNTLLAGMKHELSEQRELTKEIAKSASKAQITQTLSGKA